MTKKTNFDPNAKADSDAGVFGLPFSESESSLILLPVPWDATTSYGGGASRGPQLILKASQQVDLFDLELGKAYESGYFMREIPFEWLKRNDSTRADVERVRHHSVETDFEGESMAESLSLTELSERRSSINAVSKELNEWVYRQSLSILESGKLLGVIGGDHSTPLGAMKAIHKISKGQFGVLHIDAHADLREAYEGFQYSHASIMYNLMTSDFAPKKLVQVGIRDFCEQEYDFIKSESKRVRTFFDMELKQRLMSGESWETLVREIIRELPEKVYVSFDIDGLDPSLCPNTGTPVPGGLLFEQALRLFSMLAQEKKTIVGFDLNEVSSGMTDGEWDGNVGARLLYKLCGWSVVTQKKALTPKK